MTLVAIVMGVSGSGKTTVGRLAARELGWEFVDADDFHSPASVAKMKQGVALDDSDRRPWLQRLRGVVEVHLGSGTPMVLACSALKREYRDVLSGDDGRVRFVYLKGSPELIGRRIRERSGHYMNPELLESQFRALEEPNEALILDVAHPPDRLAQEIATRLTAPDAAGET